MDLGKKIAIIMLLATIAISVKMIRDQNSPLGPEVAGQSDAWLYRRKIVIENEVGRKRFEKDIPIIVNTQELIASGKLQPNCNDIRFLDEDGRTPLRYQIPDPEKGCNKSKTEIWIKINSLPAEGKTIYFLYGNSIAPNFESSWSLQ